MKNNIYPKNYQSVLNLVDTQRAIKLIKDTFERKLTKIIDDSDKKPRGNLREEISRLICSDRGKRRRGYFRR
jgi:hypothetical protein